MWGWFVGSLWYLWFWSCFANFFKGLEILRRIYEGTLLGLFGPYALIGGVLFVLISVTSGALWIKVKIEGVLATKAGDIAKKTSIVVLVLSLVYLAYSFAGIEGFKSNYSAKTSMYAMPALEIIAAFLDLFFAKQDKAFMAFCCNLGTILFIVESGLASIYPYMLKSSVALEYGIDVFEAASAR
jgi:cytochrome d ubiquinol oxidase subunit II